MSKASRDKGQRGEREVCKLLEGHLGIAFKRNLMQTAEGGHDVLGLDGCAIEVKRCEKLALEKWWKQTVTQAKDVSALPVLFFRRNSEEWTVAVPTFTLMNWITLPMDNHYSLMSVTQFTQFYSQLKAKGGL
jgi:Holliday junction resolvase|tara:strand:+ start:9105 stop:9500 length:396 start_codon:yes stop_codon:yes gene_type:complete